VLSARPFYLYVGLGRPVAEALNGVVPASFSLYVSLNATCCPLPCCRWYNEAGMWLAVQSEVQDEAAKLKEAMQVSLREQQAAREAEAAAPPLALLSEERLRKKFHASVVLKHLSRLGAVLPDWVLFSDRMPLREKVKHKVGGASSSGGGMHESCCRPLSSHQHTAGEVRVVSCTTSRLGRHWDCLLPCGHPGCADCPPVCAACVQLVELLRLEADCNKWWPERGTQKYFEDAAGRQLCSEAASVERAHALLPEC
jgi:hypothetical protein